MVNPVLHGLSAVLLLTALNACASIPVPADIPYTTADFDRIDKIDAHVHANVSDPGFVDFARAQRFRLVSINVDYPEFPALPVQADVAERLRRHDPATFAYVTTFSMKDFGTAGWADATRGAIASAVAKGAIGVKVWKNIGMVERGDDGKLILLDDPRFDPVMAFIESRGLPLVAHQAEPRNAWLPADQMTTNNDRLYFTAHPEYHSYLHPEQPRYEELLGARDRFVAAHPRLPVIGAHLGSLEWSVDALAQFLDAHPNAVVDMAARMSELQNQSNKDPARVRNFLIKYQDRILYATDLTENPPSAEAKVENPPIDHFKAFAQAADQVWRSDWRYLATAESQYIEALKTEAKGIALPRSVIRKIYFENAQRVFFKK